MTTEKFIEKVNNIIVSLPEEDKQAAAYMLSKSPERFGDTGTTPALLTDLLKDLQEDLKNEAAKASGRLSAKKAADKILNQIPEGKVSGGYMSGDRQIIGGAYSVVRICSPLPVREFPAGADHINYDNIINQASENAGAVLTIPTLADLKAHIKIEKATHKGQKGYKPLWDFGEGLPRVDAAFLLEVLTILGECKAVCGYASPTKQPLYFKNKSGDDAILLPVMR